VSKGPELCAWPVGRGEYRIQSRSGELTRMLRSLGLEQCGKAVLGGHMTIWKVCGKDRQARQRVERILRRNGGRMLT
jgi:hypothetical protein